MKGHYMREAQPSGKLGHLAPYLKIDEYPPLPKALRVHLDSASPILTRSSHSQHTSRIRKCDLSRRPQTMLQFSILEMEINGKREREKPMFSPP